MPSLSDRAQARLVTLLIAPGPDAPLAPIGLFKPPAMLVKTRGAIRFGTAHSAKRQRDGARRTGIGAAAALHALRHRTIPQIGVRIDKLGARLGARLASNVLDITQTCLGIDRGTESPIERGHKRQQRP